MINLSIISIGISQIPWIVSVHPGGLILKFPSFFNSAYFSVTTFYFKSLLFFGCAFDICPPRAVGQEKTAGQNWHLNTVTSFTLVISFNFMRPSLTWVAVLSLPMRIYEKLMLWPHSSMLKYDSTRSSSDLTLFSSSQLLMDLKL